MIEDYIFCPLCGGVDWTSDKTGTTKEARLTWYKCTACKKFSYTNATSIVKNTFLIGVTEVKRYAVKAEIEPYRINILHDVNETVIRDAYTSKEILTIAKALDFNWYRPEEVIEKIKFYLLFS